MKPKPTTLARRMIAKSDLDAERLIGIIRMTLAAMLFAGVSFVLSQTRSAGLEPRTFELLWLMAGAACYFALGFATFRFASPERFKPWMSWAFNFAEIAILSAQLYIDVMDPQTPSLIALASPLLLVAALVICVQVLRFRLDLHIVSAATMVAVAAFIVFHDPQTGVPPTPSVIEELLIVYSPPPNIMRLVMLGAMGLVIGIAVFRSRRLVERVARETEEAENRKRFLPRELSERMDDDAMAVLREGEEREIAIMYADLRGFTALSATMQPKETAAFLARYRALVLDTTVGHGGVVDKFIGDGALIVFGLQTSLDEASEKAVNAGREMFSALEEWNVSRLSKGRDALRMVITLHAGPAIIGAIGDDRRLEFTVIGDTVNTASRMESLAKDRDLDFIASSYAAKKAGLSAKELESLGDVTLRGSAVPLELCVVQQIR